MGLMAGPERPPTTLASRGLTGLDINCHAGNGVYEGQDIGARIL